MMASTNLTAASNHLFDRRQDETFKTLEELTAYCQKTREVSRQRWLHSEDVGVKAVQDLLCISDRAGGDAFSLNDWSFGQLCSLCGVSKQTVNRLSPRLAEDVLNETLPENHENKPWQLYTVDNRLRSLHPASYTRLYNAEVLEAIGKAADGFTPPPVSPLNGGTGLYAGEQDVFAFLLDSTSWVEIEGEGFMPGFFVWNSEVGRRTVGISTFWFQAVCANHIVWDATDITTLNRKHTTNVREVLDDISFAIERLAAQRDERKDGFSRKILSAMQKELGGDAAAVCRILGQKGFTKTLAKKACDEALKRHGILTIFTMVDALTRLSQDSRYIGKRTEADMAAAKLLTLAA